MWFGRGRPPRRDRGRRRRRRVLLWLEGLEDRLTPSGVVVGTTVAEVALAAVHTELVSQATAAQGAAASALTHQAANVTALGEAQASLLTNVALTTLSQQTAGALGAVPLAGSLPTAGSLTQQAAAALSMAQGQATPVGGAARGVSPLVLSLPAGNAAPAGKATPVAGTNSDPAGSEPDGGGGGDATAAPSAHGPSASAGEGSSVATPAAEVLAVVVPAGRLASVSSSPSANPSAPASPSATGPVVTVRAPTFTVTDYLGAPAVVPVVVPALAGVRSAAIYLLPADLAAGDYLLQAAYPDAGAAPGAGRVGPAGTPPSSAPARPAGTGTSAAALGDEPPPAGPPAEPPSLLEAALTLYLDGAETILLGLTGHPAAPAGLRLDTPYALPHAPLLVLAGELASSPAAGPPR